MIRATALLLLGAAPAAANPWPGSVAALPARIDQAHANPERLPGGRFALTPPLAARMAEAGEGEPTRSALPETGWRGAGADIAAGPDGFVHTLPIGRLMAIDGTPREDFRPRALARCEGD